MRHWWETSGDAAEMMVFAARMGVDPVILGTQLVALLAPVRGELPDDTERVVVVFLSWVLGEADTQELVDAIDAFDAWDRHRRPDFTSAVVYGISALATWWSTLLFDSEKLDPSALAPLREALAAMGQEYGGQHRMAVAVRRAIPYSCLAGAWLARLTGDDLCHGAG